MSAATEKPIEWAGQGNMTSHLRRPRDPFTATWTCPECRIAHLPPYMLSCPTLGCRGKRPK